MGLFNVQEICTRTNRLGLGGKVTISHGFCLGGITERKVAEAAAMMAEAGVALVTYGAGGLTMPPIEMLRAAGVLVFAGNDAHRRSGLAITASGSARGQSIYHRRELCPRSRRCSPAAQAGPFRRQGRRARRGRFWQHISITAEA